MDASKGGGTRMHTPVVIVRQLFFGMEAMFLNIFSISYQQYCKQTLSET